MPAVAEAASPTDTRQTSAGGRVLAVTAFGDDLHQARDRAYEAVGAVSLAGSHHRTDIARLDASEVETELRRFVRHTVLGMLVANEALLFRSRNQRAINIKGGRRVVRNGTGQSE